jgi:hypothetical protein
MLVRVDLVRAQFGALLADMRLPDNWYEMVQRKMREIAEATGVDQDAQRRERERLKLKRSRVLKQHREGYIDDKEFQSEMAATELLLRELEAPHVNGVRLDQVLEAGNRLPDMAAFWDVATPQERRDMVMLLLEQGGLYYDLQQQCIIALRPRPAFRYVLRLIDGIEEKEEDASLLLIKKNCQQMIEIRSGPYELPWWDTPTLVVGVFIWLNVLACHMNECGSEYSRFCLHLRETFLFRSCLCCLTSRLSDSSRQAPCREA